MANVNLKGEFDLNLDTALANSLFRTPLEVVDFVVSCVSYASSGFVKSSGAVKASDNTGRQVVVPGRFYFLVGVPDILIQFHKVAPETLLNELFSLDHQEKYGITNITLNFQ